MPALIEDPQRANRLARTIASDLSLYNREKVEQGILNDDLFERLAEEIQAGREHYASRVAESLREQTHFFDHALVDVLLRGQAHLPAKIW
ncbi:MAG: hypothetical protein RBU45_10010 [Myxococcota bacterium]|jgi:spore germination protein GerM|nr:hypothetical protein [Myxococcota bacterium]